MNTQKPVLAFMQNMWVKNPDRIRAMIATKPEAEREAYRRQVISRLLFMGCITGQRLTTTFGEWCDRIVWEESTREIAGNPRDVFPADLEHMRNVIREVQPRAIITFGKVAERALCELHINGIQAPHPAARQSDVMRELCRARMLLAERFEIFDGEPPVIHLPNTLL